MKENKKSELSQQIESVLTEIASDQDLNEFVMTQIDEETLSIEDELYKIVINYREAFDLDALQGRYQDYFKKFDYIVGDWGYDQLRLKGFYEGNRRKCFREQMIDYLDIYLKEYCNFGCRYFVIAKASLKPQKGNKRTSTLSHKKTKSVTIQTKQPIVNSTIKTNQTHESYNAFNKGNKRRKVDSKTTKTKQDTFQMTSQERKKRTNSQASNKMVQKGKHFVIKQPSK